jgi:hypothetical protein
MPNNELLIISLDLLIRLIFNTCGKKQDLIDKISDFLGLLL